MNPHEHWTLQLECAETLTEWRGFSSPEKLERSREQLIGFIFAYGPQPVTPESFSWVDPEEAQKMIDLYTKARNGG